MKVFYYIILIMNTKRLTSLSMLIAIYVVLSILTPIRIVNLKVTFEAFPILIAGLLMGPIDGLLVGAIGSSIYQLLFSGYGITITTILWILPHAISGLVVGLFGKMKNYDYKLYEIIIISCISAFIVTGLNILALYVDSKVYAYYSNTLVFGNLFLKIIIGIILSIIYSIIMPKLLTMFKKQIDR